MRRISAKYAQPGMVLGYPVYDNFGTKLLTAHTKLDEDCLKVLLNNVITEIFIEDWHVADIPVAPLISPELEGRAARALRKLHTESAGKMNVSDKNIYDISTAANAMAEELTLTSVGEVTVAAIAVQEDYIYVQPVKTALISLAMGQALGYRMSDLAALGIAALLKDIGYILLPREIIQKPDVLTNDELSKLQQHPKYGYNLLRQHSSCSNEIATAVLQHHEQWNGNGYPLGLKSTNTSRLAQIIAIADKYTALLSKRPGNKKVYMPHDAIEYVMAYSGEYFNPELVELFVRRVACYCSGLTVKLNTGEIGIISDAKLGFVGRPVVRICIDAEGGTLKKPYDVDLSKADSQHKLVVEILDYD